MSWNATPEHVLWRSIEQDIHERKTVGSPYIAAQTWVERFAHQVVAEASRPFNRVLEIGIGGGEHLAFEHQRPGRQYFGIELVLDYAKVCHLNGQAPVAIGDAADLPFPSAGFDCVIAVGVLEHVEAISRVTRELKRVLCPGGSLLVIVPPNGGLTVGLVKLLLTYPTMMARGIKRPDLIWNYQNANSYKRVLAFLATHFDVRRSFGIPLRWLPWWLAPFWFFELTSR